MTVTVQSVLVHKFILSLSILVLFDLRFRTWFMSGTYVGTVWYITRAVHVFGTYSVVLILLTVCLFLLVTSLHTKFQHWLIQYDESHWWVYTLMCRISRYCQHSRSNKYNFTDDKDGCRRWAPEPEKSQLTPWASNVIKCGS